METCCPQYTIRLDVNKFTLSRTQKRVLRHMNDFLMYDTKPKMSSTQQQSNEGIPQTPHRYDPSNSTRSIRELPNDKKCSSHTDQKPSSVSANEESNQQQQSRTASETTEISSKRVDQVKPRERGIKKKFKRRERAFQRMRSKGIDIEEVKKKRAAKEESRRRTLESFFLPYDEAKFKHRLEVRLVKVGSSEFVESVDESYEVYRKYQTTIHNDSDCDKKGYLNFLADSPLYGNEKLSSSPKSIEMGSYHEQYLLDGRIIAVGVLDVLPRCLSAKYFYYDPQYNFLSLGTYSALKEIALTRELAKERPELHYYYMGYYINSCPKMRYKGRFRPSDLLCDRSFTWVPLDECLRQMRIHGEKIEAFAPDKPSAPGLDAGLVRCFFRRRITTFALVIENNSDYTDEDDSVKEYAQLVGPVAKEMLLYIS